MERMTRAVKEALKSGWRGYAHATRWMRGLPDFLIIGAQKAGTTSMYNYLISHPRVARSTRKEVRYFAQNFHRSLEWYRGHFASALYERLRTQSRPLLRGESSPCYLFHPHAARRAAATLPELKVILLLRNPVDRAFSHFRHEVRKGHETLSFPAAIDAEAERLDGALERMLEDEYYYSVNYHHYSYLRRGLYIDDLREWERHFPPEQLIVLRSEDFHENPAETISKVYDFLDLPQITLTRYRKYNRFGRRPEMDSNLRRRLLDYFRPFNEALEDHLSRDLGWNE